MTASMICSCRWVGFSKECDSDVRRLGVRPRRHYRRHRNHWYHRNHRDYRRHRCHRRRRWHFLHLSLSSRGHSRLRSLDLLDPAFDLLEIDSCRRPELVPSDCGNNAAILLPNLQPVLESAAVHLAAKGLPSPSRRPSGSGECPRPTLASTRCRLARRPAEARSPAAHPGDPCGGASRRAAWGTAGKGSARCQPAGRLRSLWSSLSASEVLTQVLEAAAAAAEASRNPAQSSGPSHHHPGHGPEKHSTSSPRKLRW